MDNALKTSTEFSWSQIVANGRSLKVPTMATRFEQDGARKNLEQKIIYECEDLADQMRIHRAETILQQALHDDAVLFELPRAEISHYIDAYRMIQDKCGRVLGCRNIDNGRKNRQQFFLIETTFATMESTEQAITRGVTIKGIQYRGTPAHNGRGDIPQMVRVNLSGVPFAEEEDLRDTIKQSMAIYGKICQIKMTKNSGFFEGEISVLLDRQGNAEPLQRYTVAR
ncbi:hypothetical protein BC941DRAFT_519671 [Chlamydoabsidia padenii]|nr:hypothetical protein BC941DRAFT_519671 [Chlamydoabsidia padenii]